MSRTLALSFFLMSCPLLGGCSPTDTASAPQGVSPEGAAFLLTEAPGDAISVSQAKQRAGESADLGEMVLVGAVNEPWDVGRAAFLLGDLADSADSAEALSEGDELADPPGPPGESPVSVRDADPAEADQADADASAAEDDQQGHDHQGHDHDNCPFCKKSRENKPLVVVQFVDEQGRILNIDARQLLGLTAGQKVFVKGRGVKDSLGNVVVTASGVYLGKASS